MVEIQEFIEEVFCPKNQLSTIVQHVIYSRFQVAFQSPVPKFVLNIPNYITKFVWNLQSQVCMLVNDVPKYRTKVLKYRSKVLKY